MNRTEELEALRRELEQVPPELEFTLTRAKARAKKRARLKWAGMPAGALAGVFAAFVLLVNAVPTFALACSGVPVLADLAAAVDWSGSLKAAVENQYVQPVGQSQTQNGITLTVDYLIVDQKQVNLFLTTENEDETYPYTDLSWDILSQDGGYSVLSYGEHENGQLRRITVDFEDTVPSELEVKFTLWPFTGLDRDTPIPYEDARDYDPAAEFTFTIQFDPAFTASGERIPIGQWVELDGQQLYLERLDVYPSHASLRLADHPDNTLRLVDFDFYLEDGDGVRYETESGLSGRSDPDTGFAFERRVASFWFARSESLMLHITGVSWRDEENNKVTVDLKNSTAEGLPEGVVFEGVSACEDRTVLNFRLPYLPGGVAFTLFDGAYTDPDGGVHEVSSWGSSTSENPDTFQNHYYLTDYPYDSVTLTANRTQWHRLETPITIQLR